MDRQKITALSVELLFRYYDKDAAPLLRRMDEDALWCGPGEGRFLQGREAIAAAFAAEDDPRTFTVGGLKAETVSSGPSLCVVVLTYSLVTHSPGENNLARNQRTSLTWCERTAVAENGKRDRIPRILHCSVADLYPKSAEETPGFPAAPLTGERLRFHGMGSTEYYLFSDSILWGDSCGNGRRCLLHLTDGSTAEVTTSVRDVAAAYPSLFLRCHASHLVNPRYVKSLRRFAVTMSGGAELPIPEKSYTAFKRALRSFA